jgi:hypothetical protein
VVQGNPPAAIAVADIDSICVSYTQPTQGSTILHCRILPNPASNNPGSCN